MSVRRAAVLVASILVVLLAPATASAGGWAISSFTELPDGFEPGATYEVEYTVLQHGQTPVDVGDTAVVFRSADGQELRFAGEPTGRVGTYRAVIVMPESGEWTWQVDQGDFGPHDLGSVPDVSDAATGTPSSSTLRLLLPLALGLALALLVVEVRRLLNERADRPSEQAA